MTTRDEDFIDHVFVASTHSYLLIFTNRGQVYWLKVYEIPDVGTAGKGKAIVNLVNMSKDEKIADIISVKDFESERYVVMATRNGIVKKTALTEYSNPRSAGHHRHPRPGRRRADRVRADRWLLRCAAGDPHGQGDPLLRNRRARHGPHRARRHRHPAGEGRPRGRDVALSRGWAIS